MDPVVSKTIAGDLKSGWRSDNSKTLVPQVIHNAKNNSQHTVKHRKFSEITGASHGSKGYIHHIGQAKRNHQEKSDVSRVFIQVQCGQASRYQKLRGNVDW